MEIKSIGLRSDLFYLENYSTFIEKENYLVVKSLDNPEFFWGNFLLYKKPPSENDCDIWPVDFKNEFIENPNVKHISLTWDVFGAKPLVEKFINAGFEYNEVIVLVAEKVKTTKDLNLPIIFKKIESNFEWNQVLNLQVSVGIETDNYKEVIYRDFLTKRYHAYKKLVEENQGHWFGAFYKGELVSDLGLFGNDDFARFQSIETHKEFRGKGIAQHLIKFAMESMPKKQYIIQADHDGEAINLYMKIGFEIKEVLGSLCLYNQIDWKK